MKLSELKQNQIFKTEHGLMLYAGLNDCGFTCDICHKVRTNTHEFLSYDDLDVLKNNPGGFYQNDHYGTECVKQFVAQLNSNDIVEVKS